jgi:hypothetical protein
MMKYHKGGESPGATICPPLILTDSAYLIFVG